MHTSLKTINAAEGRVGGYLIVWGSPQQRDLQGEYFTPETELGLAWYPQRPVLYHHGLDGELKAAVIGAIDTLRPDEVGVWAEAQLDMRQRYVRAVQRLIDKGVLGWSSGSLPHLVEVAEDGRIKRWPVVEGSLTPAPAEPRRTDVTVIKSAYAVLGLDATPLTPQSDEVVGAMRTSLLQDDAREPIALTAQSQLSRRNKQGGNAMHDDMNNDMPPARKRLPLPNTAERPSGIKAQISVGSQFDTLDALDMLHGYVLLRATKNFRGVSEQYSNALAYKLQRAGMLPGTIKADELSYSTQAGFGDEWVPDLWSAQLWQKARLENVVLPLFRSIEMAQTLDGRVILAQGCLRRR